MLNFDRSNKTRINSTDALGFEQGPTFCCVAKSGVFHKSYWKCQIAVLLQMFQWQHGFVTILSTCLRSFLIHSAVGSDFPKQFVTAFAGQF